MVDCARRRVRLRGHKLIGRSCERGTHIIRASGTQLDHFQVLSTLTVAKVREKIEGMVVLPPQQFVYIPRPDHAAV